MSFTAIYELRESSYANFPSSSFEREMAKNSVKTLKSISEIFFADDF